MKDRKDGKENQGYNRKIAKDKDDEYPYLKCPNGEWLKSVKTIKVFDGKTKKQDVFEKQKKKEDMRCIVCTSGLRFCHRNKKNSTFKQQTEILFNEIVHLKCNKTGCFNNGIATNKTGKICGYNFTAGANVIKLFLST